MKYLLTKRSFKMICLFKKLNYLRVYFYMHELFPKNLVTYFFSQVIDVAFAQIYAN